MKKVGIFAFLLLVLFAAALLFNTLKSSPKQIKVTPIKNVSLSDTIVTSLSLAVKIPTISYDDSNEIDSTAFNALVKLIEHRFPLCNATLQKEVINTFSLVYIWHGKDKQHAPVILTAHNDVVPANGKWQLPPFSGAIKDGYIWGRGTLDDKVSVIGILEATELLLKENYTPERTIIMAFGHDEETTGEHGAQSIVKWLKSQHIKKAEFLLDEGLVITEGIVPGLSPAAALIGIAEKGILTVKLSTTIEGGHASMPQSKSAIGVICHSIVRLQEHPFKARLTEPAIKFLHHIGPEMPFYKNVVFANTWLFEKFIINEYEKTSSGNALVRTTLAPVIVHSGYKSNVIPTYAEAVINLRILPGDSLPAIINYIKKIINDERVKIEVMDYHNPSKVSSTDSRGYQLINKSIRQVFPDVIVAPSLMIAGTDSKHYADIADNIYRFLPIRLAKEDLSRIHGVDEKISMEGYKRVVQFYYQLIKNI